MLLDLADRGGYRLSIPALDTGAGMSGEFDQLETELPRLLDRRLGPGSWVVRFRDEAWAEYADISDPVPTRTVPVDYASRRSAATATATGREYVGHLPHGPTLTGAATFLELRGHAYAAAAAMFPQDVVQCQFRWLDDRRMDLR